MKQVKNNEKQQHSIRLHTHLCDCIVISPMDKSLLDLCPKKDEVIVDIATGQSVLRGSHIFAPGIMAMTPGKIFQFVCYSIKYCLCLVVYRNGQKHFMINQ